jgi:hypothetical protein
MISLIQSHFLAHYNWLQSQSDPTALTNAQEAVLLAETLNKFTNVFHASGIILSAAVGAAGLEDFSLMLEILNSVDDRGMYR